MSNNLFSPHDRSLKALNWLLVALLGLGLGLRWVDLTDQPLDFHPTRQLRGAIVARGVYYSLLPNVNAEVRQQAIAFWHSTGENEPPILERLVALTYLLVGEEKLWISRIYTSLFWLIGGVALFALAKRMTSYQNNGSAVFSTVISFMGAFIVLGYYLVLPFAVQASRSFQPDPGMVMWIILASYALYRWSEEHGWKWAVLSGLLGGVAILTKAVAAYILAGIAVAMILSVYGWKGVMKGIRSLQVWLIFFLMLAPTVIYYITRTERASEYFSNWTIALSHLLLDPWTYLRWLNLTQELVGWLALLLALVGIFLARGRNRALLLGLWAGYVMYGLFLPYQMYTHSYYHLQLIPIVAISLLPVVMLVLRFISRQKVVWWILLLGVMIGWLIYSARLTVVALLAKDYRQEPAYWQEIASHLPSEGKTLALTQDYGYRLMYYGWQKVLLWPNRGEIELAILRGNARDFDEFFAERIQGKSYFLITAFKQLEDQPELKQLLYERYPIYAQGEGYVIFDLMHPKGASTGGHKHIFEGVH